MKVLVYEPEEMARVTLSACLRDGGHSVVSFGDAHVALMFVLSRPYDVDGIILNVDATGHGVWLLEHLGLLPEPLSVVTFSSDDGASGAQIHEQLIMNRPSSGLIV